MICALIGDQTIRNLNEERLELRLRTLIEQEHVSAFVLGYFGPFERLAFQRDPALAAGLSAAGLYSDPMRTAKRETGRAGA